MEKFIRAMAAQDDFDLAFRLQLQEALAASSYPAKIFFQEAKQQAAAPSDDGALALALQNEELSWSQKQEQDRLLSARKTEQLQLEIKQRTHDAAFAQSLMDMDDSEWEAGGKLLQNPFNPRSTSRAAQSAFFCKLYITVASSKNNTLLAPTDPLFAMSAVILDSRNFVLTELKKAFEPGTNKLCADYMALLAGLQTIHAMGFQHIEAHTDSLVLYNQVTNRWRVKYRKIQGLWSQVMEYVHNLPAFRIYLDPRNQNEHATQLAREAVSEVGNEAAVGRGSKSASQLCNICLESKPPALMVKVSGCSHEFCSTCIAQHAEVKIQAGLVPVNCPHFGCKTMLGLGQCQSVLSQKWFDSLRKRLVEASIPEGERVYCPYLRCSALMDRRHLSANAASSSRIFTTRKMCVKCARYFCVECRVPWHSSISCSNYQKLPPELRYAEDAKLHQLAENQKWQHCKKCKQMIELSEGCYHMTCRCGCEFCYLCGKEWKDKAATCKCRLWDEAYLLHQQAPLVNNEVENNVNAHLQVDNMEIDEVENNVNAHLEVDTVEINEVDERSFWCMLFHRVLQLCSWGS